MKKSFFEALSEEIEQETIGIQILFGLVCVLGVFLMLNLILDDKPEVIFSSSNGQCLKVNNINPKDHYSCENLPEKYEYFYGE